jgi:uncharacterized damage-inducible protein DinB
VDLRYLRSCFDHSAWASDLVCQRAQELTEAEYLGPAGLSFESIHATLLHALDAETIWLSRWEGGLPSSHLSVENVPTLAALRQRWQENAAKLERYLGVLSDDSLRREVRFTPAGGHEQTRPLWQLMYHVLHHSAQFRSEAAVALSRLGHSPGSLDFLRYLAEHPE